MINIIRIIKDIVQIPIDFHEKVLAWLQMIMREKFVDCCSDGVNGPELCIPTQHEELFRKWMKCFLQ